VEKIGENIPLGTTKRTFLKGGIENDPWQKAEIWEIWCLENRTVYWVAEGMDVICDAKEDPLQLESFFPCPQFMLANPTSQDYVPRADYILAQDQYDELNNVTTRITMLEKAIKVVGVYDASASGVQRMLQQGSENSLIPVDNWAIFAEKGGVKGSVDWLPLGEVIAALERLRQARDDIKGQIYELTGISDIVRGNTKASETLGAQNLKAQFASVRIQKLQDEVARFAEEILRLKGEIICRHFVPQQILKLANMEFYPDIQDPQVVDAAVQLLKGDHEEFEWRVNVQADSLAMTDYAQQKQEKVEFMNAVATLLQSAATTMKAVPESAPILFESLKFSISGFKGAQELEGVIDRTLAEIMQKIKNPPPPPPDPAVEKVKVEMQVKQQEAQMNAQAKQQEMAMKQQESQAKLAAEREKMQMDLVFKQQEHQQTMAHEQQKFEMQRAQNEAMARQQMVADARKDAAETKGESDAD